MLLIYPFFGYFTAFRGIFRNQGGFLESRSGAVFRLPISATVLNVLTTVYQTNLSAANLRFAYQTEISGYDYDLAFSVRDINGTGNAAEKTYWLALCK